MGERASTSSARRAASDRAKMLVRSQLYRRNLELAKDPLPRRIVAALLWLGLDTVLDVGANVGQYGDGLRASGYRGRIISFEPLAEAHGRLAHRAAKDAN